MGSEKKMQPTLLHLPISKDIVFTPEKLAKDMVVWFIDPTKPAGGFLDPCMGDGAFYKLLPAGAHWCEIEKGRDFYACNLLYNTIIGNPPYSNLLAWIRHSMKLADNVIYLMPLHRVFASNEFLDDLEKWGG